MASGNRDNQGAITIPTLEVCVGVRTRSMFLAVLYDSRVFRILPRIYRCEFLQAYDTSEADITADCDLRQVHRQIQH